MKVFEFTIVASGLDPDTDDFEDRLFDAGCDDATIVVKGGAIVLEFARDADSLSDAIESAMASVRSAGAEIVRVEPDNLVSLSEIAERSGLTRAAISNYAKGERGKEFPRPVARVTSESPLWEWTDVAAWLHARGQIKADALADARTIRAANDGLEGRQRRRRHYA
jgi:predicted DNA-binding transcriptional regulator AlpA